VCWRAVMRSCSDGSAMVALSCDLPQRAATGAVAAAIRLPLRPAVAKHAQRQDRPAWPES
jgi:hypothetical protein